MFTNKDASLVITSSHYDSTLGSYIVSMAGRQIELLPGMRSGVQVCQVVSRYANWCPGMPLGVKVCQVVSRYAKWCPGIPSGVQVCQVCQVVSIQLLCGIIVSNSNTQQCNQIAFVVQLVIRFLPGPKVVVEGTDISDLITNTDGTLNIFQVRMHTGVKPRLIYQQQTICRCELFPYQTHTHTHIHTHNHAHTTVYTQYTQRHNTHTHTPTHTSTTHFIETSNAEERQFPGKKLFPQDEGVVEISHSVTEDQYKHPTIVVELLEHNIKVSLVIKLEYDQGQMPAELLLIPDQLESRHDIPELCTMLQNISLCFTKIFLPTVGV